MDGASVATGGPRSARRSGLAEDAESVASRFSNRYDEDVEMGGAAGSPSPSRQYRTARPGSAGRHARRASRTVGGGPPSVSRSHHYGESDEESYYLEEEVGGG